jgi:ABC-type maltose transport system permease subunit
MPAKERKRNIKLFIILEVIAVLLCISLAFLIERINSLEAYSTEIILLYVGLSIAVVDFISKGR